MNYAYSNELIPIVDISYKSKTTDQNLWEYFFVQPSGYSLNSEIENNSIIISGVDTFRPKLSMDFLTNECLIDFWREFFLKNIAYSSAIQTRFNGNLEQIESKIKLNNTLGVLCRGTDYIKLRPQLHPVQPTKEYMIQRTKEKLNEFNIDDIFLVTEDKNIADLFKKTFGHRVYQVDNNQVSDYDSGYLRNHLLKSSDPILVQWEKYFSNIFLLSKCHYMLASRTSGSVVAYLMASNNMKSDFINLGTYGVDDESFYRRENV